ncbi:methyl-accepting chemotaxis sensory transducer [Spirochaeta thermophila DSM 6578]|uniref:Methyl-accepting chemotaxis sensory transducer n=1 Tax=Winmispira thermophila (strain ATCC 700085 / DSM 6578 / Z-1203) TaxID=869211 RepID=G0GBU4_WINT7|nr:[Fe-Fe] hydrogenase large subunit C-terminal domain-containing protein [Spirochaeta thermophila]AEJ61955.1 methyl-accepting chemotaxis sensory transducer [Spirochaeta thermophila DSM 6578]
MVYSQPLIDVDPARCVSCHRCIAVCPVKYANDGSGEVVEVRPELCIGCGECLKACTHGARRVVDDLEEALEALRGGKKVVAFVAPAAAAHFGEHHLRLNGWLKAMGARAVFDVSFGAELTIASYVHYLKTERPGFLIAQPCPAVVSYLELYQPELLPYLAPVDSPMVHVMKMVKAFYPEYRDHEFLVVSPCVAKKREFLTVGVGTYNVTMRRLVDYFEREGVDLSTYAEEEFDNDPAERAVWFSNPGGLLATLAREMPEVVSRTRKIEGPQVLYPYFKEIPQALERGSAPLLLDCLNCELGCNGGPGTRFQTGPRDVLEEAVRRRADRMMASYRKRGLLPGGGRRALSRLLSRYWRPHLYRRSYEDRSQMVDLPVLTDEVKARIFRELGKTTPADERNCGACGYLSCEGMARALAAGLTRKEHCVLYLLKEEEAQRRRVSEQRLVQQELILALYSVIDGFRKALGCVNADVLLATARELQQVHGELLSGVRKMEEVLRENYNTMEESSTHVFSAQEDVEEVGRRARLLRERSATIPEMVSLIAEVADRTRLLALNASIEAAHVGVAGKGFGVIAHEIRKLADETMASAEGIGRKAQELVGDIAFLEEASNREASRLGEVVPAMERLLFSLSDLIQTVQQSMGLLSQVGFSTKQQEELFQTIAATVEQMTQTAEESLSLKDQRVEVSNILRLAERLGNVGLSTARTD